MPAWHGVCVRSDCLRDKRKNQNLVMLRKLRSLTMQVIRFSLAALVLTALVGFSSVKVNAAKAGNGGDATATGGNATGGKAQAGNGGGATATGGNGGNANGKGAKGGNGGDAVAINGNNNTVIIDKSKNITINGGGRGF